ncbi:MAG: NAD-dependent deacylase [Planctomycetes bacterium]|nr:NAD-dependent deacylase [Planctomycetota bacterium]NOG55852.1 NAD-dependent deacylase [Planctomycetota bacterium]
MGIQLDPELVDAIRAAESVVVMTGAGISAESGIPTFRDELTGMWENYDPEQLATPQAFERDPETVSRWYDQRRANIAKCEPNAGHQALATLERWQTKDRGRRFTLLTQNIDGLHRRAGSANVVELHGTIWRWRCTKTGREREYRHIPFPSYPPLSEDGGLLRPAVVWFGEMLPEREMMTAQRECESCDVYFSIGTSTQVFPAAGLIQLAHASGARTVEVNPETTPVSNLVDWSLRGPAGTVLPGLVERVMPPTGT